MENKFSQEKISEIIALAEAKSKHKDRRFWLLSSIWAVLLIVITSVFFKVLVDMDRLQAENLTLRNELDTLNTKLNLQWEQMENRKKVTDNILKLFNNMYYTMLENLDEQSKEEKAEEIAQKQLSRAYVTASEQRFLKQETNNPASELPGYRNYYFSGVTAMEEGNVNKAIDDFSKAINLKSDYANAYFARGRAYQKINEHRKAESDFSIYLDLKPNSPEILASRAFSYLKMEEFGQSKEDCRQAIAIDSSYWVPYHYLGFSNYLTKDFELAKKYWDKAANLRIGLREKSESLENIGLVYLSQKKWSEQIDHAKKVNDLYAKNSWNWFFLYVAASETKNEKLAKEALARWKELKDTDDDNTLKFYLPAFLHKYLG